MLLILRVCPFFSIVYNNIFADKIFILIGLREFLFKETFANFGTLRTSRVKRNEII